MEKVVYSVYRSGKPETKFKGVGFIKGNDLLLRRISKSGKPYYQTFYDCIKCCHPKLDDPTQYTGEFYDIQEALLETKHGNFDTREVEVFYKVWFKKI